MIQFLRIVALGCAAFAAPTAHAAELLAQLFPLTGEVRLVNPNSTAVPLVYVSIESPAGALDGSIGVWKSITDTYDRPAGSTPGNGFIDSNGDWVKLSSDATGLTEGAIDLDGGSLPAYRAITLGYIWNPYHVEYPDLQFDIRDDLQSIPVNIELALDGDYSSDHTVDTGDYLMWRKFVDSMTAYFADGDLDGIVDMDDYLVWQQNFGVTLPLPPYIAGSGNNSTSGVPEPGSAAWVIAATMMSVCTSRPRRSSR